jgi:hypothetical protein
MLLELAAEKVMICRFAGESIAVLCKHHIDAPGGHEVPYTVHTWPLQAGATLAGVRDLFEYLVPFAYRVSSQGFYLLGERVARAGLLVRGDASVEDGAARAVAVC